MGAKIKGNQRTGQAGSLRVEGLGERGEEGCRQEEAESATGGGLYSRDLGFS